MRPRFRCRFAKAHFFSAIGAMALFTVGIITLPLSALAQSKYTSDDIIVAAKSGGFSAVRLLTCSASAVGKTVVAIAIGNDRCFAWAASANASLRLFAKITAQQIHFTSGGKDYVVRDKETIEAARKLFSPLEGLLEKQSAAYQGMTVQYQRTGKSSQEIKIQVPDMSADFAHLQTEAKRLSVQGATEVELGRLQSELGNLQERIGALQPDAAAQQAQIGRQSRLGQQESAGADNQMINLSRQEQALTLKMVDDLKAILDRAVQNSVAMPGCANCEP